MGLAAMVVERFGYNEINVNCGYPSARVGEGTGARLMKDPSLVVRIVTEMRLKVSIPVTVKCRIGVDDLDQFEDLLSFIKVVSEEGGVNKFIIHARKAKLVGATIKENRTKMALNHPWIFRLKEMLPHLNFVINGGLDTIEKVKEIMSDSHPLRHHNGLEGCMVGYLAKKAPWECARIDREIFGDTESETQTREEIITEYAEYC